MKSFQMPVTCRMMATTSIGVAIGSMTDQKMRKKPAPSTRAGHPRQPQHPQEERALAQGAPQCAVSFHADNRVLAQSGRSMVLDLAGTVPQRRLLHKPQTAPGAHRCLHQRI